MVVVYDAHKFAGYELLLHRTGSALFSHRTLPQSLLCGGLTVLLSYEPSAQKWLSSHILSATALFSAFAFIVGLVVVTRAQQAFERFWTAQIAYFEMASKMHDVGAFCDAFLGSKDEVTQCLRRMILRWLRLAHELAMEDLQGFEFEPEKRKVVLTIEEGVLLRRERIRSVRVMSWIMKSMVVYRDLFDTGDAVLSRTFQIITQSNLAFNNARRIAETPFPFPFAQLTVLMVNMWALISPVVWAAFFPSSYVYAPVVAIVCTWSLYAINEGSAALEAPFDDSDNCFPLVYYTVSFNDYISGVEFLEIPIYLETGEARRAALQKNGRVKHLGGWEGGVKHPRDDVIRAVDEVVHKELESRGLGETRPEIPELGVAPVSDKVSSPPNPPTLERSLRKGRPTVFDLFGEDALQSSTSDTAQDMEMMESAGDDALVPPMPDMAHIDLGSERATEQAVPLDLRRAYSTGLGSADLLPAEVDHVLPEVPSRRSSLFHRSASADDVMLPTRGKVAKHKLYQKYPSVAQLQKKLDSGSRAADTEIASRRSTRLRGSGAGAGVEAKAEAEVEETDTFEEVFTSKDMYNDGEVPSAYYNTIAGADADAMASMLQAERAQLRKRIATDAYEDALRKRAHRASVRRHWHARRPVASHAPSSGRSLAKTRSLTLSARTDGSMQKKGSKRKNGSLKGDTDLDTRRGADKASAGLLGDDEDHLDPEQGALHRDVAGSRAADSTTLAMSANHEQQNQRTLTEAMGAYFQAWIRNSHETATRRMEAELRIPEENPTVLRARGEFTRFR